MKIESTFSLSTATLTQVDQYQPILTNDEYDLIKANISDRVENYSLTQLVIYLLTKI